jgi:hypothetical protein
MVPLITGILALSARSLAGWHIPVPRRVDAILTESRQLLGETRELAKRAKEIWPEQQGFEEPKIDNLDSDEPEEADTEPRKPGGKSLDTVIQELENKVTAARTRWEGYSTQVRELRNGPNADPVKAAETSKELATRLDTEARKLDQQWRPLRDLAASMEGAFRQWNLLVGKVDGLSREWDVIPGRIERTQTELGEIDKLLGWDGSQPAPTGTALAAMDRQEIERFVLTALGLAVARPPLTDTGALANEGGHRVPTADEQARAHEGQVKSTADAREARRTLDQAAAECASVGKENVAPAKKKFAMQLTPPPRTTIQNWQQRLGRVGDDLSSAAKIMDELVAERRLSVQTADAQVHSGRRPWWKRLLGILPSFMLPLAWRDMPPIPPASAPAPVPASPPEAADGHVSAPVPPVVGLGDVPEVPAKHNGDVPAQQSGVENAKVGMDKEERR